MWKLGSFVSHIFKSNPRVFQTEYITFQCNDRLGFRLGFCLATRRMATHSVLKRPSGNLAYFSNAGQSPGVIFCSGYCSNMNGTKATALQEYCERNNRSYIRFDYTGCGQSDGEFHSCTLGQWKQDLLDILDQLTTGPQVLVGSSMGGWLMLLVAQERPERIQALVGVAAAPDFTCWRNYPEQVLKDIKDKGVAYYDTAYGGMSISGVFLEESKNHWLLNSHKISVNCPVRLIHGMRDDTVPYNVALQITEKVDTNDVEIMLTKCGDHRMSTSRDIHLLTSTLHSLLDVVIPNTTF